MTNVDVLYDGLIAFAVVGSAWLATRSRTWYRTLLWALAAACVPVLILNIVVPPEIIKAEIYWYWDMPSFLIKSLSAVASISVLLFGASVSAWAVSVRWKKAKWLGIASGILTALILYIPAGIIGLLVACQSGDCV